MIITAVEGKVFRRKEDGMIYGDRISLGYSYYIGGVKLNEPHLDVPEDFEEIDAPSAYQNGIPTEVWTEHQIIEDAQGETNELNNL